MPEPAAASAPEVFRLAVVPGVTPARWIGTWRERVPDVPLDLVPVAARDGADLLRAGGADAGLVRLPFDRAGLAVIPLYTEVPVVIVPTDHAIAAFDEVRVADLVDEVLLLPLDDVLTWATLPGVPAAERPLTTSDAVELVAAGVGVLVVPQSLARLHHRRDVTYRTVSDGPASQVALAWVEERASDLVEEFVGIVRGRTARSSRGRGAPTPDAVAAQAGPGDGRPGDPQGKGDAKAGSKGRRTPAPRVPGDQRARGARGGPNGRAKPGARRGGPRSR